MTDGGPPLLYTKPKPQPEVALQASAPAQAWNVARPGFGAASWGSGTRRRASGTLTWEARAPGQARSSTRRTSARSEPGPILPSAARLLGEAGRCSPAGPGVPALRRSLAAPEATRVRSRQHDTVPAATRGGASLVAEAGRGGAAEPGMRRLGARPSRCSGRRQGATPRYQGWPVPTLGCPTARRPHRPPERPRLLPVARG